SPYPFDQVLGEPYAHKVARAIPIQILVQDLEHTVHLEPFLSDGQPSDPKAGPVAKALNGRRGLTPKGGVHAALNNREPRLWIDGLDPLECRIPADQPR